MSATQQIPGSESPTPIADAKRANPIGLTALIVGGVALVASVVPLVNYVSGVLALVGLVLGIIAWTLKGRKKLLAVLGTIVSLVALALSILLAAVYTAGFAEVVGGLIGSTDSTAEDVSIVYEVTGDDGATASVAYSTFVEGTPTQKEVSDIPLPFTQEVTATVGGDHIFSGFTLTAIPTNLDTPLTCTILIDGEVVDQGSGTISCSATYMLESRE
jgi:hypothetical protein